MSQIFWRRFAFHYSKQNENLFDEFMHNDSLMFSCKYLGTIPINNNNEEEIVNKKIDLKKSFTNKQSKVRLLISPNTVCIDSQLRQNESLLEIPINNIAYCVVDRKHKNTVAFVSRNVETNLLECHAFVTNRSKQLTTAFVQAFQLANDQ